MRYVTSDVLADSLRRLAGLDLTKASQSALEAFITAKRLEATAAAVTISEVNSAVDHIFVIDHDQPKGRVQPFRRNPTEVSLAPQWGKNDQSGRMTVWNVTTRGRQTSAASLFASGDIRNGLLADAPRLLGDHLKRPGDETITVDGEALIAFLLRDASFEDEADWNSIEQRLLREYNLAIPDLLKFAFVEDPHRSILGPERWSLDGLPTALRPPVEHVSATRGTASQAPSVPLVIDERIRRMVSTAILSTSAVLLVGPPGTGKTQLLQEVIKEIQEDPQAHGLENELEDPAWVTPDESWTALELAGGLTISPSQKLAFRPGHVLRAIGEDRWLVLDEANRADMDKIFGGLLTWLSDQEVELGPASTAVDAPTVRLGWSSDPQSFLEGIEELGDNPPGAHDQVRFMAGTEWRLLGTYNAQDAQRVFRFGQALGRRFIRVPIPPPSKSDFRKALNPYCEGLPVDVANAIEIIYAAHQSRELTRLGPAVFLRIPIYMKSAVGLLEEQSEDAAEAWSRLLAEAYLANVGTWLARYGSDDLAKLQEMIAGPDKALPEDEWDWLASLLWTLG